MPQGTTVAERLEMDVMVVDPRKLTKNSKKPTIPMTPRTCAMNAMTDPNLGNVGSSMGPRKSDTRKSTNDRAEGDDGDADERAGRIFAIWIWV